MVRLTISLPQTNFSYEYGTCTYTACGFVSARTHTQFSTQVSVWPDWEACLFHANSVLSVWKHHVRTHAPTHTQFVWHFFFHCDTNTHARHSKIKRWTKIWETVYMHMVLCPCHYLYVRHIQRGIREGVPEWFGMGKMSTVRERLGSLRPKMKKKAKLFHSSLSLNWSWCKWSSQGRPTWSWNMVKPGLQSPGQDGDAVCCRNPDLSRATISFNTLAYPSLIWVISRHSTFHLATIQLRVCQDEGEQLHGLPEHTAQALKRSYFFSKLISDSQWQTGKGAPIPTTARWMANSLWIPAACKCMKKAFQSTGFLTSSSSPSSVEKFSTVCSFCPCCLPAADHGCVWRELRLRCMQCCAGDAYGSGWPAHAQCGMLQTQISWWWRHCKTWRCRSRSRDPRALLCSCPRGRSLCVQLAHWSQALFFALLWKWSDCALKKSKEENHEEKGGVGLVPSIRKVWLVQANVERCWSRACWRSFART